MSRPLPRRRFLASLATGLIAGGKLLPSAPAEDLLYALQPGDIGRLRADFNTHRERVRLVAILSPT